jgi:sporulation protein YlmC with PRC-barrel domain|tara:strand:- start:5812 stop:6159 length:348 start_codon:yes stop_codon:yes gene_type:complete
MLIKAKKIIGNKVISQSGQFLGRVVDFEIDTFGQNIIKYYVAGGFLNLPKDSLLINVKQIVEIKKDSIIVEDAVIPEKVINKKISSDVEYAPLEESRGIYKLRNRNNIKKFDNLN